MKIVARIEKIAVDQYLFDGRVFDSFLSARREMAERMRQRRFPQGIPVKTRDGKGTVPLISLSSLALGYRQGRDTV